jgi:uncharacterized membrane protein YkoI
MNYEVRQLNAIVAIAIMGILTMIFASTSAHANKITQAVPQTLVSEGAEGRDGQDKVPDDIPTISSNEALQAVQSYLNTTTFGKPILDDENGVLIYSIELDGIDLKVNAMNGAVLGVDQVSDELCE